MTQLELPLRISLTDDERNQMMQELNAEPDATFFDDLWTALEESLSFMRDDIATLPLLDRSEIPLRCDGLSRELEYIDDLVHRIKNRLK